MKKKMFGLIIAGMVITSTASCEQNSALNIQRKDATVQTAQVNQAVYNQLDFSDQREYEFAKRGLMVAAPKDFEIYDDQGKVVWSLKSFEFVKGKSPQEVNPSLWRNTELNAYAGLFEVCDGIYQVRGYDMANVTYIRSDNGWIIVDVLMCKENAQAAHELVKKNLFKKYEKNNIVAVVYSHPHVDHYGGIAGFLAEEDVADRTLPLDKQIASGKTAILAPADFLQHAVSENIYTGRAMARRAQYQYGPLLPVDKKGSLAMGIGLGQSRGTVALIAPTYEVSETMQNLTIDGIKMQFQLTPGTEAPCEMNIWLPESKALWMAENCVGTMHNLYTLRGAQVRDAAAWSKYICDAITEFGSEATVVFQSHNWPHWGNKEINDYLQNTAAVYKYINNQTLNYINRGYTATEIANEMKLPEKLDRVWYTRQYYGTLSHNIKAVYQRYMGWYDANPVNLNLLPPEESAKKLVQYMDTQKALELAKQDFAKGEYQWVAQITKELVYADPANTQARLLCADALEQLGYQAESGPWRNVYLMGAMELRNGINAINKNSGKNLESMMSGMTITMLLDYVGIVTDVKKAENDNLSIYLNITDTGEKILVKRENGVLLYFTDTKNTKADATITCTSDELKATLMGQSKKPLSVTGDKTCLPRLAKYIISPITNFNIIEP